MKREGKRRKDDIGHQWCEDEKKRSSEEKKKTRRREENIILVISRLDENRVVVNENIY